jgi:hypothetical protein
MPRPIRPIDDGLILSRHQSRKQSTDRMSSIKTPTLCHFLRRFPRKAGWVEHVNAPQREAEVAAIRRSVERASPFGNESWSDRAIRRLGLESTVRARGRPKKQQHGSRHLYRAPLSCSDTSSVPDREERSALRNVGRLVDLRASQRNETSETCSRGIRARHSSDRPQVKCRAGHKVADFVKSFTQFLRGSRSVKKGSR